MRLLLAVSLLVSATAPALADDRCVDVEFTPTDHLQIVAWVETPTGQYVDTLYITQQTGSFGLGNRPGRFDFNSAPEWPYGRRITTFPVWSHRHGLAFPVVMFQSDYMPNTGTPFQDPNFCFSLSGPDYTLCGENNLSHGFDQSSHENHYCRPMTRDDPADVAAWDANTCATTAYSDKGRFSTAATTGYPPRVDLIRSAGDSPSVDMYKMMNPFDAVSQPTPVGGAVAHASWSASMAAGDYVLFIETGKESDMNDTYNPTSYPAPTGITFSTWGLPYRGQPSIVYRLPFTIGTTPTSASTSMYAGYGSPDGTDGDLHLPDNTITMDTPGSGAARLQLVSDGGEMYRVKISIDPNQGGAPPPAPSGLQATHVDSTGVSLSFFAPGVGAEHKKVSGYEIRVRASDEMTVANFADSMPVTAHVAPGDPGSVQSFDLTALLPQTDYWVGIRAFDDCHNSGDLAIVHVQTTERVSGSVDACFVATAAYGSLLANDVEMLRHVRDTLLRTNAFGELGVEAYYTFGPALASVVGDSELLRASARGMLAPVVDRVRGLAY